MDSIILNLNGKAYTRRDIIDMINNNKVINFTYGLEWMKDLENPFKVADNIAKAFKNAYGPIICSAEYYYNQHEVSTIMDVLYGGEYGIEGAVSWILYRAFKKAGFKHAVECAMIDLRNSFAQAGKYHPYALSKVNYLPNGRHEFIHGTYEYDQMKKDHSELNKELVQYVNHPRFIAKWLDGGNELEDYLN